MTLRSKGASSADWQQAMSGEDFSEGSSRSCVEEGDGAFHLPELKSVPASHLRDLDSVPDFQNSGNHSETTFRDFLSVMEVTT